MPVKWIDEGKKFLMEALQVPLSEESTKNIERVHVKDASLFLFRGSLQLERYRGNASGCSHRQLGK